MNPRFNQTPVRNKFGSKKMKVMLRNCFEGPYENFDDIIEETISL